MVEEREVAFHNHYDDTTCWEMELSDTISYKWDIQDLVHRWRGSVMNRHEGLVGIGSGHWYLQHLYCMIEMASMTHFMLHPLRIEVPRRIRQFPPSDTGIRLS